MKTLSRRALFAQMGTAMVGATMLAGCVTTKDGHVTTATINVAKINAYVLAGINAATTVSTVVSMVPVLAVHSVPLKKIMTILQGTQVAFMAAVGDKIEISYDDTSIKTLIDSILAALQNLAEQIKAVVVNMINANLSVGIDDVNKVELTYNSIATIVSIFRALLTSTLVSRETQMNVRQELALNEQTALRSLGV